MASRRTRVINTLDFEPYLTYDMASRFQTDQGVKRLEQAAAGVPCRPLLGIRRSSRSLDRLRVYTNTATNIQSFGTDAAPG